MQREIAVDHPVTSGVNRLVTGDRDDLTEHRPTTARSGGSHACGNHLMVRWPEHTRSYGQSSDGGCCAYRDLANVISDQFRKPQIAIRPAGDPVGLATGSGD